MNERINLIENLNEEEQKLVYNMVSKAKGREELNEICLIQGMLKIDMKETIEKGNEFQEISSSKAPPLVKNYPNVEKILLPKEYIPLSLTLENVLRKRHSIRDYSGEPLDLKEISTLLYYSYGVRRYIHAYNIKDFPLRMAPSAGGLQAIELYIVANKINNLKKGIYHYNPFDHSLELISEGNFRREMVNLCVFQEFVHYSSCVIILTCMMNRLLWKYNIRAYRYIHMDAGFVGENIYLVTCGLKLGCCAIAGFFDDELNKLLDLDGESEFVTLLMSIGKSIKKR